jgi:hypothetical protein
MRGGSRPNAGAKPQAGTPRSHTLRFRVSEAEMAEVSAVVPDGELSDLCRDLLLAYVRR